MDVEKRDVDINKLFYWSDKFNIYDSNKEVLYTYYARVVGDAELNRSRVFALRSSASLRKELRKEDSDERLAYIPDFEDVSDDKLVDLILFFSMKDYTQQAMKEVIVKYPVEPKSEATLEKMEKYQKEVDDFPEKRNKEYTKFINNKLEQQKKELAKLTREQLIFKYIEFTINQVCESEMIKRFNEMNAFFGSYREEDLKERLFNSFEEFDNLPSPIKQQFIDNYSSLELSIDTLKKLPEVVQ
jgi:hypothetical protein